MRCGAAVNVDIAENESLHIPCFGTVLCRCEGRDKRQAGSDDARTVDADDVRFKAHNQRMPSHGTARS
jgi:hypothetical protein